MLKFMLLLVLSSSLYVGCSHHKSKKNKVTTKIKHIDKEKNKKPFILSDQEFKKILEECREDSKKTLKDPDSVYFDSRNKNFQKTIPSDDPKGYCEWIFGK